MFICNGFIFYPKRDTIGVIFAILFLLFCLQLEIIAGGMGGIAVQNEFVITGTEYYRRGKFDSGEIRIFLKNTGNTLMSVSECKFSRLTETKSEEKYLYAKLSPPILQPGGDGELLVKLMKAQRDNEKLKCIVFGNTGVSQEIEIPAEQTPIWVSYVGFSEDLRKVYVYVKNNTNDTIKVRLLEVGSEDVGGAYQAVNDWLGPGDKGCMVFEMRKLLSLGEYIPIVLSAEWANREIKTQRIVKAVNKYPILFENGSGDSKLGLDSEIFFCRSSSFAGNVPCVQNMVCPAHDHGTHNKAAKKFLDDRDSIFHEMPNRLTMMWICRSGRPESWYKFGVLSDVAVMNTVLSSTFEYDREGGEFSPFFWLASMAKKATSPNRYLACVPVVPESSLFLQKNHTAEEIRFLVYCAVAGGANGILYRGRPDSHGLNRDAFVRMNKELQQLKPLLPIAEPVDWVFTGNAGYAVHSLLCGDKGILALVFDRRYFSKQQKNKYYTPAFSRRALPVKVNVKIPEFFSVSKVESGHGELCNKSWNFKAGKLELMLNMVDSVQVCKIVFARSTDAAELSKETRVLCENRDTN